jgi:hypothetical protein
MTPNCNISLSASLYLSHPPNNYAIYFRRSKVFKCDKNGPTKYWLEYGGFPRTLLRSRFDVGPLLDIDSQFIALHSQPPHMLEPVIFLALVTTHTRRWSYQDAQFFPDGSNVHRSR